MKEEYKRRPAAAAGYSHANAYNKTMSRESITSGGGERLKSSLERSSGRNYRNATTAHSNNQQPRHDPFKSTTEAGGDEDEEEDFHFDFD